LIQAIIHIVKSLHAKSKIDEMEQFYANEREALANRQKPLTKFDKVNNLILENLNNPQFSIESLADEMEVSTRTIGRIVQKKTKMNTIDWIIKHRMNKAKFLLDQTLCESPQEVAQNVGYTNYSYFSKVYEETFGKSPQSYFTP